jgi:hypothetical protein
MDETHCGISSILLDRRSFTTGMLSALGLSTASKAQSVPGVAGCVYLQAGCSFAEKGTSTFASIRRMMDNAEFGIGAIGVELTQLLEVTANPAFYDDGGSGIGGNAGALLKPLFPALPGTPAAEGTIVFGTKCYAGLEAESAAIAAVYAHELGHILQYKFVSNELFNLRNQDKSVVRAELHADFVCGYYAAYRKEKQPDWPVVIQAITQFKFGDYQYANPLHHGTPAERSAAVQAGLKYGLGGRKRPVEVSRAGLEYVKTLVLDQTSKPDACKPTGI